MVLNEPEDFGKSLFIKKVTSLWTSSIGEGKFWCRDILQNDIQQNDNKRNEIQQIKSK